MTPRSVEPLTDGARSGRGIAMRRMVAAAILVAGACVAGANDPWPGVHHADANGIITIDAIAHQVSSKSAWITTEKVDGNSEVVVLRAPDPSSPATSAAEPLSYRVAIDAEDPLYVWVRGYAPDRDRDSIHIGLNGDWDSRVPMEFASVGTWTWTETTVHDDRGILLPQAEGEHVLTVWPRDEAVLLERIVLTTDSRFVPEPEPADVLWSTDHESGSLADWSSSSGDIFCGGEVNNAGAVANISSKLAHSGTYSVELRIADVDGDQGTRMFRGRCESRTLEGLYYSAWLYFPQAYRTEGGWWNVWQWKSRPPDEKDSRVQWVLDVRGDGNDMRFRLREKLDDDSVWHDQDDPLPIPIGRWFHVEAFYLSDAEDGRVVVWQDGVEIFRFHDVATIEPGGDTRWSVNNYTSDIDPDPAVLYVDDASIATQRLGPANFLYEKPSP